MPDRITVGFYVIDGFCKTDLVVYENENGKFFVSTPGKRFGMRITPLSGPIEILVSVDGISPKTMQYSRMEEVGYCIPEKELAGGGYGQIDIAMFKSRGYFGVPFTFFGKELDRANPLEEDYREFRYHYGIVAVAVFDVHYPDCKVPDTGEINLEDVRIRTTEKPAEYHRFVYAETEDLRAFGVEIPPQGDRVVVSKRLTYHPFGYYNQ